MKFLILGDIHLGKGLNIGKPAEAGKLNSRIEDQINILKWIKSLCDKDKEIHNIFITGDVYQDFRPHPTLIGIFMNWLKIMENSKVFIHIVMGNHDIIRTGQFVVSALDLVSELKFPYAKVYKEIEKVNIDQECEVYLIPFKDKRMYNVKSKEDALYLLGKELMNVKKDNKKNKIAIGHLAIEGSISVGDEITDQLNELFVPIDFFEEFDYVWMGHIHHPQVLNNNNPYIAHIGSMDRSDFSKTEILHDKIAIIFDCKTNTFEEKVIPTRSLKPIKIKIDQQYSYNPTEYVKNQLSNLDLKNSIISLTIEYSTDCDSKDELIDRESIDKFLYKKSNVHYICSIKESRVGSKVDVNPEEVFDSNLDVPVLIKQWSDKIFTDDKDKSYFLNIASDIIKEYNERYN